MRGQLASRGVEPRLPILPQQVSYPPPPDWQPIELGAGQTPTIDQFVWDARYGRMVRRVTFHVVVYKPPMRPL